jgi:hypothetical protein
LMTVPGIGPVTASAIVATIQDMGARLRSEADPARAYEALCPAQQERCGRCGGDCEAAGRPSQRFVPVRSIENQARELARGDYQRSCESRKGLWTALLRRRSRFGSELWRP